MNLASSFTLLKHKRTKIIATIGPASAHPMMIAKLIDQGADVFRLNMSHGEHETHRQSYQMIRKVAQEKGKHIAVLADLCGPKIRTGTFKEGSIVLSQGEEVVMTVRDVVGEPGLIPSQYKNLTHDVGVGHRIFLADGEMELKVLSIENTDVRCLVVHGGELGEHKGINLPDSDVSAPAMTEKDVKDAAFAVDLGVDFIALSFVRSADDILQLRAHLDERGAKCGIVAKIERPEALEDADAIVQAADVVMVARGDLGVELPPEQVPIAQQMLIDVARLYHKPVIVATQVLESMIEHSRPTRAEATDIFHSVSSGACGIMLSGETAVGVYPVAAVEMMSRVILHAEAFLWKKNAFASSEVVKEHMVLPFGSAVARSTAQLSRDLMVRGIVVLSCSGETAATISSARPEAPILGISPHAEACRKMNMLWGVIPVLVESCLPENQVDIVKTLVKHYDLATDGDSVLLVQGFHQDEELNHPSVMALKV